MKTDFYSQSKNFFLLSKWVCLEDDSLTSHNSNTLPTSLYIMICSLDLFGSQNKCLTVYLLLLSRKIIDEWQIQSTCRPSYCSRISDSQMTPISYCWLTVSGRCRDVDIFAFWSGWAFRLPIRKSICCVLLVFSVDVSFHRTNDTHCTNSKKSASFSFSLFFWDWFQ